MARYLMGIDNGGTVIKAALYRLDGKEIAVASQHTPVFSPQPGYQQRDMEEVWQKNCACIRQVLKQAAISPEEVTALAVCGHGKGLYLWGKDGRPAYPGIASTDNRAWSYPGRWKESGIFSQLYPQLCQQQVACQPSALLAWLKDHEPTVYQNIQWVFSIKDYIRFRLTGTALSECTDLSGSGLMDVKNQCIDSQLLRTLGIEEAAGMIPPLCRSFDLCGQVTPEAAALTGLCPGTPVAGGMFDIDACAIAMAVTSPEQLCTITGTWSINEFISTQPKLGTKVAMNSLYAIPGYYLLEECSPTSAGNLEWNLKQLAAGLDLPQGQSLYDGVNHLVDSISPEDCQVYYLPFLYGSNAHPLATASFLSHRRPYAASCVRGGCLLTQGTHRSSSDRSSSAISHPHGRRRSKFCSLVSNVCRCSEPAHSAGFRCTGVGCSWLCNGRRSCSRYLHRLLSSRSVNGTHGNTYSSRSGPTCNLSG